MQNVRALKMQLYLVLAVLTNTSVSLLESGEGREWLYANILVLRTESHIQVYNTFLIFSLLEIMVFDAENIHKIYTYFLGLLAGPSGIRVGWGIETNGIFEAERPPTSVGPPSGGRAAFLSPIHPLYSTRPHGLAQAIFLHICSDLDLGPWYCLTH